MHTTQRNLCLLCGAAALAVAPTLRSMEIPKIDVELKGQVYVENTDYGTGQDRMGSRTDLHFQRLRLTLTSMLDDTWGFKFQTCGAVGTSKQGSIGYGATGQDVDPNDRDVRIIDAYIIGNFSDALNTKIGLTKIPLTRANLDDCFAPLSLDRSMYVYTAYGSSPAKFSRDVGAVAWGSFNEEKLKYFAGVFQGREGFTQATNPFSGAIAKSSIQPTNSLEYVGRVHYAFLDPEPGSGYQGTYFGNLNILTVGVGAAYQPKAVYRNVSAAGVVTGNDTADYTAFAADVMFETPVRGGAITVNGQYLKNNFDDACKTNFNPGDRLANIGGLNGQKDGWFVKGAYLLPQKIGKDGRLQPYAIYESWKFANLLGIDNQKITQPGVGLNYYIKEQRVRITFEYLRTKFDKPTGLIGGRVDPVTFAPLDKVSKTNTFRLMFQVVM